METYAFSAGYVEPGVTRDDAPFSPRAGLTFLATPDLSFYASWARSFRNEADGGLIREGVTPKPTRGEQFEVGAKAILLDGRAEATVAVFDLSKTNVVVSDPVDFNRVIQIGELTAQGVEAEVSARPLEPWTLVASYAFTKTEIEEHSNTSILGNWLAGVPRRQASLWTSWRFDAGPLDGLTVGGGVFHASKQAATTANNFFLPGYTRLDLNAAYAFGEGYEIRVNVDNVTDEKIYITGGFSQIYPQAPRTARVTFTRRW
ncbi:TonB-dependent receptor [Phenylobacterium sp. J426]|uniref:TonB-dependent siderophore receptor n=1 Tax=Phenylobacterium sp. J426 TaxID=2898439 RepID=UPI0021514602|nr:TonB-dependent receptor [Phenylobacterium sp. J426]MCR5876236.1 TonB-dependent receptor [Phenylobacterium sp. J426]